MSRKQVLEHIRDEVAQAGKVTPRALKLYITHRISSELYNRAVAHGLAAFNAAQAAKGLR